MHIEAGFGRERSREMLLPLPGDFCLFAETEVARLEEPASRKPCCMNDPAIAVDRPRPAWLTNQRDVGSSARHGPPRTDPHLKLEHAGAIALAQPEAISSGRSSADEILDECVRV